MSPAASTTETSGVPSPLMSATRGVSRRARSTTDGLEKVPSPLLNCDVARRRELVRAIARSVRPLPVKSPVTRAVETAGPPSA